MRTLSVVISIILACWFVSVPAPTTHAVAAVQAKPNKPKPKNHGHNKKDNPNKGPGNNSGNGNTNPNGKGPYKSNNGGSKKSIDTNRRSINRPKPDPRVTPPVKSPPTTSTPRRTQPRVDERPRSAAPASVCRVVIKKNKRFISDECVVVKVHKKDVVHQKTRVIEDTKTVTERVVYGLGIITLIVVAAAILTLLLGYVLGWRKRGLKESEFMKSLVRKR